MKTRIETCRGVATAGGGGVVRGQGGYGPKQGPAVSVSNIRDIAFTDVQKLYGPEISQFLPCMLQFLTNLRRIFILSN